MYKPSNVGLEIIADLFKLIIKAMKRLFVLAVMIVLASCGGQNKNDLMTNLINEKKVLTDSIAIVSSMEKSLTNDAADAVRAGKDSAIYHSILDSSFKYSRRGFILKDRLEKIDFSIDSLSKMK